VWQPIFLLRFYTVWADSGGSPYARKADNGKNGRIGVGLLCGTKARAIGRGRVKTRTRFFRMGSGYWLRDETSPPVFAAIANGDNSWVAVGNIFGEE